MTTYTALNIHEHKALPLAEDIQDGDRTIAMGIAAGYVRDYIDLISTEDKIKIVKLNRRLSPIEQTLSLPAKQHIVRAIHKDSPIGPLDPVGVLYMLEHSGYLKGDEKRHARHRWLVAPIRNGYDYSAWSDDFMYFLKWTLCIDPCATGGYLDTVMLRSCGYSASTLP